jgi:integrase
MQSRPYPEKDGLRLWLAPEESRQLLEHLEERPRRQLAIRLGLHGLRTDELVRVTDGDFRELVGADGYVLEISDGKTGAREVPVSKELRQRSRMLKSASRIRADDSLIDVSKRSVRHWIADAREVLEAEHAEASALGMHDLRRTWATDTFYSLAIAGNPIAEELVLSWGGWRHSATGRQTFRENYLGPVPDHVTADAIAALPEGVA